MNGDWLPIRAAPRDGTPVILWMANEENPPVLPLIVGFRTGNPLTGVGRWQTFGESPRSCSDRDIRGWLPLLHAETDAANARSLMEDSNG